MEQIKKRYKELYPLSDRQIVVLYKRCCSRLFDCALCAKNPSSTYINYISTKLILKKRGLIDENN